MSTVSDELPIYAQNLQRILADRGLQQSEVAAASGLARDAFGRYFHGKTKPPPKKLIAIAAALGVKPSEIDPDGIAFDSSEIGGDLRQPAFEISPSVSGKSGFYSLRVNVELPKNVALQIANLIEDNAS